MNDQTQNTSTLDSADLNALRVKVAELHLGIQLVTEDNGFVYEVFPYSSGVCPQPFSRLGKDGWLRQINLTDHLNDLNACAGLIDFLRQNGWTCYLDNEGGEWTCKFDSDKDYHSDTADQPAVAICRAFVATMEGRK